MKKIGGMLLVLVLCAGLAVSVAQQAVSEAVGNAQQVASTGGDQEYDLLYHKLWQIVRDRLGDEPGQELEHAFDGQMDSYQDFRRAVDKMLRQARSRGVELLTLEQAEAVKARQAGGYIGCGIAIREIELISGGLRVKKVMTASTAEDAGLKPGDVILAVGGVALKGWTWSQAASELLSGPEASTVLLTVQRGSQKLALAVKRDPIDAKIGIEIELYQPASGYKVTWVRPHSPGERAGVLEDDILAAVDGRSFDGLTAEQVREQIRRGPDNSRVVLSVVRDHKPVSLPVTRGVVFDWDGCVGFSWQGGSGVSSGEVKLKNLDWTEIVKELDEHLPDYRKIQGVIVDLRGARGEDPEIAARLAARFISTDSTLFRAVQGHGTDRTDTTYEIKSGQLLKTVNRQGVSCTEVLEEKLDPYAGKVVVLVDKSTSACAEALADSLQHSGRARVVGFTTAGRAYLTSLIEVGTTPEGERIFLSLPGGQLFAPDLGALKAVRPDRRAFVESRLADLARAELEDRPWYADPLFINVGLLSVVIAGFAVVMLVQLRRKRKQEGETADKEGEKKS